MQLGNAAAHAMLCCCCALNTMSQISLNSFSNLSLELLKQQLGTAASYSTMSLYKSASRGSVADRAFHATADDCVTGRAPHSSEGHYPAPCVVIVLHGSQLLHVLLVVPNPQGIVSAG